MGAQNPKNLELLLQNAMQPRSGLDVFEYLKQLCAAYEVSCFHFIDFEDECDPDFVLGEDQLKTRQSLFWKQLDFSTDQNDCLYETIISDATPERWVFIDLMQDDDGQMRRTISSLFLHFYNQLDLYVPACQPSPCLSIIGFGDKPNNLDDSGGIAEFSTAAIDMAGQLHNNQRSFQAKRLSA